MLETFDACAPARHDAFVDDARRRFDRRLSSAGDAVPAGTDVVVVMSKRMSDALAASVVAHLRRGGAVVPLREAAADGGLMKAVQRFLLSCVA